MTRKITRAVARIQAGLQDTLYLGNLDAERDWGYAPEYVEAMWRMLQADEPDDYVVATGEMHHGARVRASSPSATLGLDWESTSRFDARYLRPTEVDALLGDAVARPREARLGARHDIDSLIADMVTSDMRLAERDRVLRDSGHSEARRAS